MEMVIYIYMVIFMFMVMIHFIIIMELLYYVRLVGIVIVHDKEEDNGDCGHGGDEEVIVIFWIEEVGWGLMMIDCGLWWDGDCWFE